MRLLWLALIALMIWTCGGEVPYRTLSVRVNNESFDARRVRIYCDRMQVAVIREPRLNATVSRTFRIARCDEASYRVETINDAWQPFDPILINPGDTLIITIRSYLPQTYHSVRQEGT